MEDQDRQLLHQIIGALEEAEVADQRAETVALAKAFMPPEPDYEQLAADAREWITKAEAAQHDRALATLTARDTSRSVGLAKSVAPGDLAALARLARSVELRERITSQPPADHRGRLAWQVNAETASIDEQVAAVEALGAHDLPRAGNYLGPSS